MPVLPIHWTRFRVLNDLRSLSSTAVCLSGHNKWSKIKQRKGANDAKRGVVYGRANRDIMLAVRHGGSVDPNKNLMLAAAMKKAKSQDVPKDNIAAALMKAAGAQDKGDQHLVLEALAGKGRVGILIECLTNNSNRTLHKIREILASNGARFATVAFMFERRGYVKVELRRSAHYTSMAQQQEALIEQALNADVDDWNEVTSSEYSIEMEFTCPPNALARLVAAVTTSESTELLASELIYTSSRNSEPLDKEAESLIGDLVEDLEDNPDTLHVWTTLDV